MQEGNWAHWVGRVHIQVLASGPRRALLPVQHLRDAPKVQHIRRRLHQPPPPINTHSRLAGQLRIKTLRFKSTSSSSWSMVMPWQETSYNSQLGGTACGACVCARLEVVESVGRGHAAKTGSWGRRRMRRMRAP